jgi:putative transposase
MDDTCYVEERNPSLRTDQHTGMGYRGNGDDGSKLHRRYHIDVACQLSLARDVTGGSSIVLLCFFSHVAIRPPLADEVVTLIKQMAKENRTWGAKRIQGELLKLELHVSKSTIQKYIHVVRKSLPPKQNWSTFLRNHASQIWACDFLQTYDILFRTIFVFVIIELGSRRVVHFGVTRHPTDQWIAQQLRNATPFGEGPRFLIRDNDRKYGASFDRVAAGINVLKTPYKAPKANAICERFLGSLRRECLDYVLILSERHIRQVVQEYKQYFNNARPHQGIEQRIPCQLERPGTPPVNGKPASRPVLSGPHHHYYWQAMLPIDQRSHPQAFLH